MATKRTEETPAATRGKQPLGQPERIPQPFPTGGMMMGQQNASEHDAHMQRASKHSAYHATKENAPGPFGAGTSGAEGEDTDAPTHGQETMPKPFNTGKSATAGRGRNPRTPESKDWQD